MRQGEDFERQCRKANRRIILHELIIPLSIALIPIIAIVVVTILQYRGTAIRTVILLWAWLTFIWAVSRQRIK